MDRPTAERRHEGITGRPLADAVLELRGRGCSWRRIATDLAVTTRGTVTPSHEALRLWFADDDRDQQLRGLDAAADAAADAGDHAEVARLTAEARRVGSAVCA